MPSKQVFLYQYASKLSTCDDGSGELDYAEFARVLEAAEEEAEGVSSGLAPAPAARGRAPGTPQNSRGEGKSRRREEGAAGAAGVAGGAGGGARREELLPLSQMSARLLTRRALSDLAASTDTVKTNTDANFAQITRIASDTVLRSAYADVC